MKNVVRVLLVLLSCVTLANSQNNIILKINHKLANEDFKLNHPAQNNMSHEFNITRLQYYISEISIIDENNVETPISDYWALVTATDLGSTELNLGQFDISQIKSVVFHVGVDPEHNHLDPSSYPANHPLAPQAPSMHWGWSAGYRFVALEGYGGSSLNQLIQLHGLGDNNYLSTQIDLDVSAEDNQLVIAIDADYTKALENINVNSGIIVHGDYDEAQDCLKNFGRYVFSRSSFTSSNLNLSEVKKFEVFPNPLDNGFCSIKIETEALNQSYDLVINSTEGKQIAYMTNIVDNQTLDFSNESSGMYFISLIKSGKTIETLQVIVK